MQRQIVNEYDAESLINNHRDDESNHSREHNDCDSFENSVCVKNVRNILKNFHFITICYEMLDNTRSRFEKLKTFVCSVEAEERNFDEYAFSVINAISHCMSQCESAHYVKKYHQQTKAYFIVGTHEIKIDLRKNYQL